MRETLTGRLAHTRLWPIAQLLLGALPLTMLALWAYAPAEPHAFLDAEQLLLQPYAGPARELSPWGVDLRLGLLLFLALTVAMGFIGAAGRTAPATRVAAGTLASVILVFPGWVSWIVSTRMTLGAVMAVTTGVLLILLLHWSIRRLPATAAPVTALALLAGLYLTVSTAAEVTLRSNPPLRVLHEVARDPESPVANLAMGYHLLSLGGGDQATPYFVTAGRLLLSDIDEQRQPEFHAAAQALLHLQEATRRDQLSPPESEPEPPPQ